MEERGIQITEASTVLLKVAVFKVPCVPVHKQIDSCLDERLKRASERCRLQPLPVNWPGSLGTQKHN